MNSEPGLVEAGTCFLREAHPGDGGSKAFDA